MTQPMSTRCECCGQRIQPPSARCECGHMLYNHDDDGGKRKKARCTVWVHRDGDPLKPMSQCPCTDPKEVTS